jgi:hypothetical protein
MKIKNTNELVNLHQLLINKAKKNKNWWFTRNCKLNERNEIIINVKEKDAKMMSLVSGDNNNNKK